jgi:CheY-like chemotaxis protein
MTNTKGYQPPPDSNIESQSTPFPALKPKACILVVEDHEDTRSMFRTMLEMRGFKVVEAEDGVRAIELAKGHSPDLIIMDSNLPLLDGFETTRRLRELDSKREVPIVFISGNSLPEFKAKAYAAGCTDYLVKPFAFKEVDRVLELYLR